MVWPDNTVYEGEWQFGQIHGKGKLTRPDGHSVEGVWKHNLLVDKFYMAKLLAPKSSNSNQKSLSSIARSKHQLPHPKIDHRLEPDSSCSHSYSKRPVLDSLLNTIHSK
jgi:hypothetical protein